MKSGKTCKKVLWVRVPLPPQKLNGSIDHIDGDASNNKRENIRMICPNCDSQTETFKSKNKNSKRRNYWKEKIIKNIMEK